MFEGSFDWQHFVSALGLMLVFEGVIPFLAPQRFRRVMLEMIKQSDKQLRLGAFFTMVVGLLLLTWIA